MRLIDADKLRDNILHDSDLVSTSLYDNDTINHFLDIVDEQPEIVRHRMTNYEKIKNMNIEEMSWLLARFKECRVCPITDDCRYYDTCLQGITEWLESEAEMKNDL